jgi:hypothetical protein
MPVSCIDHFIVGKKYFGSHCIEDGRILQLVWILQRKGKRLPLLGIESVYDIKRSARKVRNNLLKFGIFSMRYLCSYSFIRSQQTRRSVGRNEFKNVGTSCCCCQKARKYGSCVRLYLQLSHTAAAILGVTAPIYSFIRPSRTLIQIPHLGHPSTHTGCWLDRKSVV